MAGAGPLGGLDHSHRSLPMSVPATATAASIAATAPAQTHEPGPLRVRDFRLLFLGEGISLAGDAFAMVALPLLVLALTADAFALGTVLAIGGAPRALLMLVGGAIVDRFSPRRVMLASNLRPTRADRGPRRGDDRRRRDAADGRRLRPCVRRGRRLLPARPERDPAEDFPTRPAPGRKRAGRRGRAAGDVHRPRGRGGGRHRGGRRPERRQHGGPRRRLRHRRPHVRVLRCGPRRDAPPVHDERSHGGESVLASILSGIRYAWGRPALRGMLLLIVAVQALIVGPFTVGLPLVVEQRLGDAAAYGIVMSTFAGGALLGMVLAACLLCAIGPAPRPSPSRVASVLGFGLVGLAFAPGLPALVVVGVVVGAANGYVGILLTSWLQPRVPADLVGRVMSLVMFAMVAVVPLSSPVAGFLIAIHPGVATIAGAGLLMAAIVLVAALRPTFRDLGLVPYAEPVAQAG